MKFLKIISVFFFVIVSSGLIYFKHLEANNPDTSLTDLEKKGDAKKIDASIILVVSATEVYNLTKADFEKIKSYKMKRVDDPFIASSKAMPVEITFKNPVNITLVYNGIIQKHEMEKEDLGSFLKYLKKK